MKKKRVSLPVKVAVIGFALYAAVTLLSLQVQIRDQQALNEAVSRQMAQQQEKNDKLKEDLESDLDQQVLMDMAREKLGLVLPGERVFMGVTH